LRIDQQAARLRGIADTQTGDERLATVERAAKAESDAAILRLQAERDAARERERTGEITRAELASAEQSYRLRVDQVLALEELDLDRVRRVAEEERQQQRKTAEERARLDAERQRKLLDDIRARKEAERDALLGASVGESTNRTLLNAVRDLTIAVQSRGI
jgi:hypothetical protein